MMVVAVVAVITIIIVRVRARDHHGENREERQGQQELSRGREPGLGCNGSHVSYDVGVRVLFKQRSYGFDGSASYEVCKALVAASDVFAMSSAVCASEMNPASNCDGAK